MVQSYEHGISGSYMADAISIHPETFFTYSKFPKTLKLFAFSTLIYATLNSNVNI